MNNKKKILILTICFVIPHLLSFSILGLCAAVCSERHNKKNYAYDLIILHQLIRFAICFAVNVWLHFLLIESKWIPVVDGFCWSALQVPYWYSTGMSCSRTCILGQGDKQHIQVDKLVSFENVVVDFCRQMLPPCGFNVTLQTLHS